MNLHTFVVGDEEFQMIQLDAFRANSYLLKLKSSVGAALTGGMDGNAANLLSLIDEKALNEIIFPLMKDCALTCTSKKIKLDGKDGMSKLFTADNLDEFYLVAWEVIKFNFGPFISKMAKNLFGVDLATVGDLLKNKMMEVGELNFAKTSIQNSGSGVQ